MLLTNQNKNTEMEIYYMTLMATPPLGGGGPFQTSISWN